MKKKKTDIKKLRLWQDRLAQNQTAYDAQVAKMDRREALYRGDNALLPITSGERKKKTPHVRNIAAELIEAQVNSSIPQPKVTARRAKDEMKAKLIEDMLRNELDRMPFEMLNDLAERTVPIQGGALFLVEWDNTQRTHYTIGELTVSVLHPKQVIPQDGVYTGIEDMDYIILKIPQTKEYIKRKYKVDVSDEGEQEPDIKGPDGDDAANDLVTQYIAYYRNQRGGIGLYSWVGDVELENLEDYQARRLRRCVKCGAAEPIGIEPLDKPTTDGNRPKTNGRGGFSHPLFTREVAGIAPTLTAELGMDAAPLDPMPRIEPTKAGAKQCPYCGASSWEESDEGFEEVYVPIQRSDGSVIPGAAPTLKASETQVNEEGMPVMEVVQEPTRIPFYKPDIYPVVLLKNISVYGQFLGDSDIDKIADQQNTTNRIEAKIIDKLIKSGSYITLPDEASIKVDTEDAKVIRPGNAASKAMIDVYDLQGNIQQDLVYLNQIYEEARQVIGITDSFQGRQDRTATSGVAKEFSAAQAAGRLESKRVMKDAAYAALFEAMFKFKLAYTDEPRSVVSYDIHGNAQYDEFNRYDFLEQDEAGEWCWNDQFLFRCDTTAPLASNREAMWQETRLNLQTGAFGDPTSITTLILFWTKMEMLHYPGAGETRAYLEEEMQRQLKMQQQMQMQQMQAQMQRMQLGREGQAPSMAGPQGQTGGQADAQEQVIRQVIEKAKADAAAAVQRSGGAEG